MSHETRIADRLLRRVKAQNRELLLAILIDVAMGLLFTVLTAGVVYCLAWFVCFMLLNIRFSPSTVALWVTAVYFTVAAVSAWWRVDPFAPLKPMSDAQHVAIAASHLMDGYVHINRHAIAGFASLLIGGPENLVGALRTWLERLPGQRALLDRAAGILVACNPEVDLKQTESSQDAVNLLRRLGLVVPRGNSTCIALTEKGRDVVGKQASIAGRQR